MLADYARFALDNLRHRKLRSWLTTIGIVIGIAAVVALLSIGQGLQNAVDAQFEEVGKNRIFVSPGGLQIGLPDVQAELSSAQLTEDDVNLVNRVRGVEHAIGMVMQSEAVTHKDETRTLTVMGVSVDEEDLEFIEKINFFNVEEGRFLRDADTSKALVGYDLAHGDVFEDKLRIGGRLTIKKQVFEVAGIHEKTGTPMHDTKVTLLEETARDLFDVPDQVDMISAETLDSADPAKVADDIERRLRRDRGLSEGEEDFSVSTAEQLVGSLKAILDIIQYFLVVIAAISLVVGAVGIMTSMYTSVLERTRQIGVMKSIGAKNSDILLIFLIEAGFLGTVGGVIGVILGLTLSGVGAWAAVNLGGIEFLEAYYGADLVVGALLFSFVVGALSGILPARRAAKMNPVDALSYR